MGIERANHVCSILLFFMILSNFTIQSSLAASTLFPNQKIHDGESLVSANKTFELGFFCPAGSNNRYVGIWYHNLTVQTIVWVANRGNPKLDSSGFITIDSYGNLIILDSIGTPTLMAYNSGSSNHTSATLLDSGNLILEASNGTRQILWQSFDYPTDNFLPGMKIGLVGQQNRLVTSWKSPQDPSMGDFQLGINPNGTEQFFIWRRGQIYWSSGIWNGKYFEEVPSTYLFGNYGYLANWSNGYYSFSLKPSTVIARTFLDYTGQLKQLQWLNGVWVVIWAQPERFSCEAPGYCGANGLCNNNTSQRCKCLFGFKPGSEQLWESGIWSGGCVRGLQLKCGDGDGFLRLTNVKLPLFSMNITDYNLSLKDCQAKCLSNCSCTACASANGNGSGCLLWFGNLMGLQDNYDGMQDLYVRVDASELKQSSDRRSKKVLLIAIPSSAVMIILFCAMIYYLCWINHRTTGNEKSQELFLLETHSNHTVSNELSVIIKHKECESGPRCSVFSFTAIAEATNSFSASTKLGEGGFGPVYMGMLEGHAIAVKRLSMGSGQGAEEFKNEITLIANLQHRNLVRLLGCCIERKEKMLIYEYMPNKSLDYYIFDPVKRAQLDWNMRFHIIEGIAQGILYLHMYSRFKVIHRDLKASNILLDNDMNPKISDFGLARIFGQDDQQVSTIRIVGTYGYMSPEYALGGHFSVKSDVFSFGVLVLEIVSGEKNASFLNSDKSMNLLAYAWHLWNQGRGMELIDRSLGDIHPIDKVLRCIQVALLSVQDNPSDRPTISEVLSMLSNGTPMLSTPKEPLFSSVGRARREDLSTNSQDICTQNHVTVTAMEGR